MPDGCRLRDESHRGAAWKGESVSIPGFGAVNKIYSRDNGREVAMVEHPFAVGLITAPHRHSREDETSIVLEGQIGFRSDDAEVVLGPGGYITKPRGQTHVMWNAGKVPGRIIELITPGSFECPRSRKRARAATMAAVSALAACRFPCPAMLRARVLRRVQGVGVLTYVEETRG
jgi:quercetin dioxygenase-like cupin family protein